MFSNFFQDGKKGRYGLLAILIALLVLAGSSYVNATSVDGKYLIEISTSPEALFSAVIFALLAAFWPRTSSHLNADEPVAILRRAGAFYIDFSIVLLVLSPFLCLLLLCVEAQFTGNFAWSFRRSFGRPSDNYLMVPGVLLIQIMLLFYFFIHLTRERQTVGKYILGYTIAPKENAVPRYRQAMFLSVIGMCMWPVTLFLAARDKDKILWWEHTSNTRAVRVQ